MLHLQGKYVFEQFLTLQLPEQGEKLAIEWRDIIERCPRSIVDFYQNATHVLRNI